MSFTFPSPEELNKQIETNAMLTSHQEQLLLEAIIQQTINSNRTIVIWPRTDLGSLNHAKNFLAGKGYNVHMETRTKGHQRDAYEVFVLVIDLR